MLPTKCLHNTCELVKMIQVVLFLQLVIRRLPPAITEDELKQELDPIPEFDYFMFHANDTR